MQNKLLVILNCESSRMHINQYLINVTVINVTMVNVILERIAITIVSYLLKKLWIYERL